jgi:HEAT repeat protein
MRIRLWIVGSVFLAAALGCEGDPNDPQTWIKQLHDTRPTVDKKTTVQKQAIQQLVRLKDKAAVEPLIALYNDPKGAKDADTLEAIISFHDPRSIPLLLAAMEYTENDFDAAAKAAEELGNLKAQQAVPILIKSLDKPLNIKARANLVKWGAIRALAEIGDHSAVEPLCKVVKALPSEQDMFLNKVAALALGKLGDPKGIPCLLYGGFIARADGATFFPEVRVAVARFGDAAVDPVLAMFQDKDPDIAALGKKLEFKPGVVQFKAAKLLGDLRPKKAVPALAAAVKGNLSDEAKGEILLTLGKIGDPAGVAAIVATVKDGKAKAEVRQVGCDGLVAAREMSALPMLLGLAKDKKTPANLRVAASLAMGRLGGKAEYDAFAPVAKAEGYAEFDEVIQRLQVAKDCSGDTDDCYIKALDGKSLPGQEKAAFMLGAAKNKQKALKALVAHLDTQVAVVRLALVDSIRRIGDKSCTECKAKLDDLVKKEEKLTTKLPQFKQIVDEMNVTLAALQRG